METIKWIYHSDNFMHSLRELFISKTFCDVNIVCESETFAAHRVVLSAGSNYFKRVLDADHSSDSLILLDFPSTVVAKLLYYIYSGEISFPSSMLDLLLKCAEQLEIKGICSTQRDENSCTPSRRKQSHPQKCVDAVQEESLLYNALNEEPLDLTQNSQLFREKSETSVDDSMNGQSNTSDEISPQQDLDNSVDSLKDATRKSKRKIVTAKQQTAPAAARGRPRNGRRWGESDTMRKAVDDVWNQRLNKSQASKKYKIPYNSLLSYVNGRHKLRAEEENNGSEIKQSTSPPSQESSGQKSPIIDVVSYQPEQKIPQPPPQKVEVQPILQPYPIQVQPELRPIQPYPEAETNMGGQQYPSHMMSWIEHSYYNPHALAYADMIARANLSQYPYQGNYGN